MNAEKSYDGPVILASGSAIRAAILRGAGLQFEVVKPGVDESIIKTEAGEAGLSNADTAMRLAEAKCMAVASSREGLVIGADQILEFEAQAYDKPADLAEARARLIAMQGKSHTLLNAVVLARDGEIIWGNAAAPELTMRSMTETEIDDYLAACGEEVLASVGAYQVEGLGARLFEKIEGDYFAVLGLAVFPLLAALRREGAMAF